MENKDHIKKFEFDYSENFDTSYSSNKFIYDLYNLKIEENKEKFESKFSLFRNLHKRFNAIYNNNLQFISRAPGRVNIIGEHIDYAGFSVLPMAVENDILIACSIEKNDEDLNDNIILEINHLNPEKYAKFFIEIRKNSANYYNIEFIKPHVWVNYILAGFNSIVKGLNISMEHLNSFDIRKINLLVTGNIPCASGLSSSSALTVASALFTLKLFNLHDQYSKFEIAIATINYERSVGTACGGMDQTISICGEIGNAKLIEFTPSLKAKTANLPKNVNFIIANSMTQSTKIDTLAYRYNKRVVENKLGLAIMAKNLNLDYIPEILIELKQNYPQKGNTIGYNELRTIIEKSLKSEDYSLEDILNILSGEENVSELLEKVPHFDEVLIKNTHFSLRNRLLHVCCEAQRVEQFYSLCEQHKDFEEENLRELGDLMNQSHLSCKNLYECSSVELDKLVQFALDNNALGARLTGAGWGGCSVIMVRNEDQEKMIAKLRYYYESNFNIYFNEDVNVEDFFFFTKASQGACLLV